MRFAFQRLLFSFAKFSLIYVHAEAHRLLPLPEIQEKVSFHLLYRILCKYANEKSVKSIEFIG